MTVRFAAAKGLFDSLAHAGYSELVRQHGYDITYDWVREQCLAHKGGRLAVLDVGCANGAIGRVLASEGVLGSIVGIDFSEAMLAKCRSDGHYQRCVLGDLNFGVPDVGHTGFDVATACGVLEYVEDVAPVIQSLRGLLKPGGELWATFELPLEARPELTAAPFKFCRSRAEALALVSGGGFSIESDEIRPAYQAVTAAPGGGLVSLGIDVHFVYIRARASAPAAPPAGR